MLLYPDTYVGTSGTVEASKRVGHNQFHDSLLEYDYAFDIGE